MSSKEKELAQLRRTYKRDRLDRISRDSRNRLKRIASTKFRTCFIFALAEFEANFGEELWGRNLQDNELTPKQMVGRDRWKQVRKRILDKGNTQLRALGMEIDLHSVTFDGYQMNFGGSINECQ